MNWYESLIGYLLVSRLMRYLSIGMLLDGGREYVSAWNFLQAHNCREFAVRKDFDLVLAQGLERTFNDLWANRYVDAAFGKPPASAPETDTNNLIGLVSAYYSKLADRRLGQVQQMQNDVY